MSSGLYGSDLSGTVGSPRRQAGHRGFSRSIGPALVSGELDQLWLYLLAPVVAGVLAAQVYDWVLAPAQPPS